MITATAIPITIDNFLGLDIQARAIEKAHKITRKLTINYGKDISLEHSGTQITALYHAKERAGGHAACVIYVPPHRIAGILSEILTPVLPDAEGNIVLTQPEHSVTSGAR